MTPYPGIATALAMTVSALVEKYIYKMHYDLQLIIGLLLVVFGSFGYIIRDIVKK